MKLREINQAEQNELQTAEQRKEILEKIIGKLGSPMCLSPKEFYWDLGTRCLEDWQQLLSYYQNNPEQLAIVNDLKERLEKIKNNELPRHNRELAKFISENLIHQS